MTETVQRSEKKFAEAKTQISTTSYIFATNDTAVIPCDANDKRFFIMDCREDYAAQDAFFAQFSQELHVDDEAAMRCLAWVLLKGWKITEDFGHTGQNPPTTSMMLLQRMANFSPEEAFIYEILRRGYVVHPDDLIDNVPLSGTPDKDRRHIWNFHPKFDTKMEKTFNSCFREKDILKNTLVRYDNEGNMIHNLFRQGRIHPGTHEPPKRTWQQVIALCDLERAYQEFRVEKGLFNKYERGNTTQKLMKIICEFTWPHDSPVLNGQQILPVLFPLHGAGGVRAWYTKNDGIREVSDRRLEYVVLPSLSRARAKFQTNVGAIFSHPRSVVVEDDDLNTSDVTEREDIRNYMNLISKVNDYGQTWTYGHYDFSGNCDWPALQLGPGEVNENGFRPRNKRKRADLALAEAMRDHKSTYGTMDTELEIVTTMKRFKNAEGAPALPPIEIVEEEVVAPVEKSIYPQEGDLAFLDVGDFDAFLADAPIANEVPMVVEDNLPTFEMNNNNNLDFPFGDDLYANTEWQDSFYLTNNDIFSQ